MGEGVNVNGADWVDNRAMVDSVHERGSRLVDPPVANVDHALLVFALERRGCGPHTLQGACIHTTIKP